MKHTLNMSVAAGRPAQLKVAMPLPKRTFLRAANRYWLERGKHFGLAQEQIQTRLLNNPDPDIAAVASDILIDKYLLTVENYRNSLTSVATQLIIFVPKSIYAYQVRRLDKMMQELTASLAETQTAEEQMSIMTKMNMLNKARTKINKKLGRV